MRFFLELSYNGDKYHGWQIQPNVITIQSEINRVLSIILEDDIKVVGAGRTDAGVHACQMYAHFDFDFDFNTSIVIDKMNKMLFKDIFIKDLFQVSKDIHARFDAISRTYEYHISFKKTPFIDHVYFLPKSLDIKSMNIACQYILGKQDFTSFSKSNTQTNTNYCNITYAKWEKHDYGYLFRIQSDRFLRNMVRSIVGTLIDVGHDKIKPIQVKDIIENKNRCSAGYSVPANALFLVNIDYSNKIDQNE